MCTWTTISLFYCHKAGGKRSRTSRDQWLRNAATNLAILWALQGGFPQILLWTACYDALPVTSLEILEPAASQRELGSSLARGTYISQMY
jgi:hypothetical protein